MFFNKTSDSAMEKFADATRFLIDTGMKILAADSEGGFIKIFLTGRNDELAVHLSETRMLNDIKIMHSSVDRYLTGIYQIPAADTERFLSMTKLFVEQDYGYGAWISFVKHYNSTLPARQCRNWVNEYLRDKYPRNRVDEDRKSIVVFSD